MEYDIYVSLTDSLWKIVLPSNLFTYHLQFVFHDISIVITTIVGIVKRLGESCFPFGVKCISRKLENSFSKSCCVRASHILWPCRKTVSVFIVQKWHRRMVLLRWYISKVSWLIQYVAGTYCSGLSVMTFWILEYTGFYNTSYIVANLKQNFKCCTNIQCNMNLAGRKTWFNETGSPLFPLKMPVPSQSFWWQKFWHSWPFCLISSHRSCGVPIDLCTCRHGSFGNAFVATSHFSTRNYFKLVQLLTWYLLNFLLEHFEAPYFNRNDSYTTAMKKVWQFFELAVVHDMYRPLWISINDCFVSIHYDWYTGFWTPSNNCHSAW